MAADKVEDRLPCENPVCTHSWGQHPSRMVFVCSKCGFEITYKELYLGLHEGMKENE